MPTRKKELGAVTPGLAASTTLGLCSGREEVVKLINTDGLAIIGPGSEWFWAMLTMIMLTITFGAVYRQLRAQTTANALQKMQFLMDRYESDQMHHARLTTALHLKYGKPGVMEPAMVQIANFWETVAGLLEDGNLRLRDVEALGRSIQMWWALLAPAIRKETEYQGAPMYDSWERLNGLLRERDAKAGYPYQRDPTTLPGILDDVIHIATGRLRMAQEVKSGVIPIVPEPAVANESP